MKQREAELQKACVRWFRMQYPGVLIHHSPNGGKRNAIEASKFKEMGTVSGFPDLFIAYPSFSFPGLFVEMKSDKGMLTENQEYVRIKLEQEGYVYHVCRSVDEFMKIVNIYMGVCDGF